MTISFTRPTTNVFPETSHKTGNFTSKLLSPALARHSSWPEIETGYKRNWQVEMAEQHRRNSQLIDYPVHPVVGLQRSHTFDASQVYTEEEHDYDDSQSQWTASSPLSDSEMPHCEWADSDFENQEPASFERGAFTPVFEDESPALVSSGHDFSSSPVGPTTPFGDFVDRAVAVADNFSDYNGSAGLKPRDYAAYTQAIYHSKTEAYQSPAAPQTQDVPPPPPSASADYKKMAAPMSQFIADYVWKACTTGMSLPTVYSLAPNAARRYSEKPPSYLAPAIHNMLLSTLLQPSAIVLAIWYVVRLPVCFDSIGLGMEHVRESNFRTELFGRGEEQLQATAPFRLVILGCMLSNKWLDDHTFSNKTWQSISNISIGSLNKLEALALDIFSHDLSAPTDQWSQWLGHLIAYHQSIYYPASRGIEPISRPSAQDFVRKMFDEVSFSTIELCRTKIHPQPVFTRSENTKKDSSLHSNQVEETDHSIEIDLDEDGPLREEYLPRRRVSGGAQDAPRSRLSSTFGRDASGDIVLPPPADWVPAADEPIVRGGAQIYRRAMFAVHPFVAPVTSQWYQDWAGQCGYMTSKAPYSAYGYDTHAPLDNRHQVAHARSQSEYEGCQSRYARDTAPRPYGVLRSAAPDENMRSLWSAQPYGTQQSNRIPFGTAHQINYAPSWLRA